MAQYNGYVSVPHDSYQEWRDATLGNGYNVDGLYGNQCWDFCALLWWQYGLTLITKSGGGTAQDCWNVSKYLNAIPPFDLVWHKTDIRRGDVVVFGNTEGEGTGHIAFADTDYSQRYYYNNAWRLDCLGQNQGSNGSDDPSNIYGVSLSGFLGAFRNTNWDSTPPSPEDKVIEQKNFPWVVAWRHWNNFKKSK